MAFYQNNATANKICNAEENESFEVLELMCDKTVSDPNSTLFKYMHSDDKDEILTDKIKRLNVQEPKDLDVGIFKYVDCTQLEDVEPPLQLWENTFVGTERNNIRTSPVKMVGLLRQSTILEGFEEDSITVLNASKSENSFKTAYKSVIHSDATSSFETANEQSVAGSSARGKEELDVDNILDAAITKANPDLLKSEKEELLHCFNQNTAVIEEQLTLSDDNYENCSLNMCTKLLQDTSIIEILSDESYENGEAAFSKIKEEETNDNFSDYRRDDKENVESESEISFQFNDTMEEVEYMMRKGLKYMYSAKDLITKRTEIVDMQVNVNALQAHKLPEFATSNRILPANGLNNSSSGAKPKEFTVKKTIAGVQVLNSPNPQLNYSDSKSKKTPFKNFHLEMKRSTVKGFFKQPSSIIARQKEFNQKHFGHIASPIHAYRQNTAKAPFMTIAKYNPTDVLDSSKFSENDTYYDSPQLGPDQFGTTIKQKYKVLPKKAYISSKLQHVVDERTPITIPGGKKMHKFLETAIIPTVLRHDGKVKVTGNLAAFGNKNGLESVSESSKRLNGPSLNDLSVISGDVSMYTMKDAQKF